MPHSEVELVVANGRSVGFDYRLADGDRIAVYPMFEAIDVGPALRLRPCPLRRTAFVVDVNLGRLARRLRMLGFDTAYRNNYKDAEVVRQSVDEHRIILTRDRRLLFHRAVTHGLWIRSTDIDRQLVEVLDRLDLHGSVEPFRRCIECNGEVEPVARERIEDRLEPLTRRHYDEFYRCLHCGRIYWPGSHYEHMQSTLARLGIQCPVP